MHYLVRAIVKAESAEEANVKTESIMEDLIDWHEFGWYVTKDYCSRWDGCWKPIRFSKKKAQAMAQETIQGQFAEFKESIETVRHMLETYSDEQIFNEEFDTSKRGYVSRFEFSRASGYDGHTCRLFGEDTESIINQKQLDWYLKNADRLWLVQVDCHN